MAKILSFGEDARRAMLRGIDKVADTVGFATIARATALAELFLPVPPVLTACAGIPASLFSSILFRQFGNFFF